ncbi:hypothetical protein AAFC00_006649 [Neodothiora populina]|uniref:Uncharacterized protein n=1 Tax=Neodothiora populina TaxID=2781224 RepID=A0ABR3PAV5_9PEZI
MNVRGILSSYLFRGRSLVCLAVLTAFTTSLYLLSSTPSHVFEHPPSHKPELEYKQQYLEWQWPRPNFPSSAVPCRGPRGRVLAESEDDQIRPFPAENVTYPEPMMGSYDAFELEKLWFTASGRYGPYGFGEDQESYNRSKVDWKGVRWGALQDSCADANEERLPKLFSFANKTRFVYRDRDQEAEPSPLVDERARIKARRATDKTGKQAIVMRTWSTYPYTEDDLQNLRSLVTEAALDRSAEYAVFLLVDVKNLDAHIHSDAANLTAELEAAVPEEFRDMAVLFDQSLLESWYPDIPEHMPMWQIMQPFQLFAHFYPEFDHYWQLEMDVRTTQHTGDLLDAFHQFSRKQPRKQSRERASWSHMPRFHGTYAEFSQRLNETLQGDAKPWGPIPVGPEISPIGPSPPTPDPRDDNFEWGVGEDADYLTASSLQDVRRLEDWVFKHWHYGFSQHSDDLPWFMSPPAQGRASWNLLNAIHHAQSQQDLRVHSEATLPSFALWHGLKVVGLPIPVFMDPLRDRAEMEFVLNGGGLDRFDDGIAMGPSRYRGESLGFFIRGLSWDWVSPMPDRMMLYWKGEKEVDDDMPGFMAVVDGEVLVPGMLIHPRKTNFYRSD